MGIPIRYVYARFDSTRLQLQLQLQSKIIHFSISFELNRNKFVYLSFKVNSFVIVCLFICLYINILSCRCFPAAVVVMYSRIMLLHSFNSASGLSEYKSQPCHQIEMKAFSKKTYKKSLLSFYGIRVLEFQCFIHNKGNHWSPQLSRK